MIISFMPARTHSTAGIIPGDFPGAEKVDMRKEFIKIGMVYVI